MATSKSKTIRANPLDAISPDSIEKVKEPIQSSEAIKPKRASKIKPAEQVSAATKSRVKKTKSVIKAQAPKKLNVDEFARDESPPAVEINVSSDSQTAAQDQGQHSTAKKCAEDIFIQELAAPHTEEDPPATAIPELPPEAFVEIKNSEARTIIKSWAQWSALGGMVPAPFVDALLVSAAQVKMIHALCKCYGVPFEKKVAVAVASGLAGGALTSTAAHFLGRSAIKSVPYVGAVFSIAVEPTLSYASSYAIGMTFVKHFESNGTLSNFNARDMKDYCSEQIYRCQAYLKDRKTSIFSTKVAT